MVRFGDELARRRAVGQIVNWILERQDLDEPRTSYLRLRLSLNLQHCRWNAARQVWALCGLAQEGADGLADGFVGHAVLCRNATICSVSATRVHLGLPLPIEQRRIWKL